MAHSTKLRIATSKCRGSGSSKRARILNLSLIINENVSHKSRSRALRRIITHWGAGDIHLKSVTFFPYFHVKWRSIFSQLKFGLRSDFKALKLVG